ncbi:proton-conducting transporter membrane subunit [Tistrella bauzanensis]|nr:proton-conducting transporter membrane subunit [Tistrella bauzanensis]
MMTDAGMTDAGLFATLPPTVLLLLGALLTALLPRALRAVPVILAPLATLAVVWLLPDGAGPAHAWLDQVLVPVSVDATGRAFATIFALAALAGGLYALPRAGTTELVAAQGYGAGAIGLAFAGDLLTVLVFWEILAVGSTVVIWAAGTDRARRAAMRYLQVHLFGGMVLMVGIAGHLAGGGDNTVAALTDGLNAGIWTAWMILAGVVINAGAPPLWSWVSDAYPTASSTGMVFLSAFTTKAAVLVLIRLFPGAEILIWTGIVMAAYGAVYALVENDLRRVLAFSIVSQVGFMVTAVGIGTPLALAGASAQAFAHILYKSLMTMAAGHMVAATGRRDLADLAGIGRRMPLTWAALLIGGLGLAAVPLTAGFVSKGVILSAAGKDGFGVAWACLVGLAVVSSVYAALKLPIVLWGTTGARRITTTSRGLDGGTLAEPGVMQMVAMAFLAALVIGIGMVPGTLLGLFPASADYAVFTADHLITQVQLLAAAAVVWFLAAPRLAPGHGRLRDLDWIYRSLIPRLASEFAIHGDPLRSGIVRRIRHRIDFVMASVFRIHGPEAPLARDWPTGGTVLGITVMLGLCLVVYYAA